MTHGAASNPCHDVEQDAALAAAQTYEKLHTGTYKTQTGRRRKIDEEASWFIDTQWIQKCIKVV